MTTTSDSEIQADVIAELKNDPTIRPENIGVAVHKGVVTLSGIVPQYAQKRAAEKATMRVRGVKGVASDGKVTLRSKVHSGWERSAASKAAWRTAGVRAVSNELEIDS